MESIDISFEIIYLILGAYSYNLGTAVGDYIPFRLFEVYSSSH